MTAPFRDMRLPGAFVVALTAPDDFVEWRERARRLIQADLPPDRVAWEAPGVNGADRFGQGIRRLPQPPPDAPHPRATRKFLELAQRAIGHSDPARFDLLYRLLWRLQANPTLMSDAADPDVRRIAELASIFAPARLSVSGKTRPAAPLVPERVAGRQTREAAMVEAGAGQFEGVERPRSLKAIGQAIQVCRRCPIGCNGTDAVMGEGPRDAALMVVGEQPGDVEEREGRPFVGPAGRLLRAHLEDAGIDDKRVYVTNAVKHFKFVQRGKRRLHQSPTAREIDICRWWVESERAIVRPQLVLALGGSAGRGMIGKTVSVQKVRGMPHTLEDGAELWITTHPSYLLRLQDEGRALEEQRFAADLRKIAARLGELTG